MLCDFFDHIRQRFFGGSFHHHKRCLCCLDCNFHFPTNQNLNIALFLFTVIFISLSTKNFCINIRFAGRCLYCDFHFPIKPNVCQDFCINIKFAFCLRRRPPSCWIQCRLAWRWERWISEKQTLIKTISNKISTISGWSWYFDIIALHFRSASCYFSHPSWVYVAALAARTSNSSLMFARSWNVSMRLSTRNRSRTPLQPSM